MTARMFLIFVIMLLFDRIAQAEVRCLAQWPDSHSLMPDGGSPYHLVPVEGDPFASQAPAPPAHHLVPVDGDPFASENRSGRAAHRLPPAQVGAGDDETHEPEIGQSQTVASNNKKFFPSGRTPSAGQCVSALVEGTIASGDYEKLLGLIERSNPFFFDVYLNSPGGDVKEAMDIGRLVRHMMLTVTAPFLGDIRAPLKAWVDENGRITNTGLYMYDDSRPSRPPSLICAGDRLSCGCASACVLIWAAGARRNGDALGFHRPVIVGKNFSSMDAETAQKTYAMVLSEIRAYLEKMELPTKAIDLLMTTESGDVHWLNDDEINGEIIDSLDWSASFPPSIEEWIASSCGSITKAEYQKVLRQYDPLSPRSSPLEEQFREIDKCAIGKLDNYRDSILHVVPP